MPKKSPKTKHNVPFLNELEKADKHKLRSRDFFSLDWENFLILKQNESFQSDIAKLRHDFKIPQSGFLSLADYQDWFGSSEGHEQLNIGLNNLIKKATEFNGRHFQLFFNYFFYNRIDDKDFPKRFNLFYKGSIPSIKHSGSNGYFIEVFPETNRDDLEAALYLLKRVMVNKGVNVTVPQPNTQLQYDLDVLQNFNYGDFIDENTRKMNNKYGQNNDSDYVKRRLDEVQKKVDRAYKITK